MDALLSGMRSQKLNLKGMMSDVILLYDRKRRTEAITVAAKYRADGRQIQMMKWYREKSLEDYKQYALHHGFSEIWYLPANGELQFWKMCIRDSRYPDPVCPPGTDPFSGCHE